MTSSPTRILIVEDNPADAYLLQKFLATTEALELVHVEQLRQAISSLDEARFDAILLDLSLPDSHGIATVRKIREADPELPILVLTGLDDEETAIASLREGAQDYLVKGQIHRNWLIRAIHYAIERQQTLDKLQHLNAELERSNQELEQFAHVVSHDLQQPLQTMLGFAQILSLSSDRVLDESAKECISRILDSGRRMSALIQDLLVYSRVGAPERSHEPTDCNQVVRQALAELDPLISECNAVVTTETLPTISANKTQLMQLFQNLLDNALKYRSLKQAPTVRISAEHRATEWLFGVHDNGIGIEPKYFDRIFQIFQRLHRQDEYSGTGIGLATCKKIVESHGGRIWLDSHPGEGTSVFFALPA